MKQKILAINSCNECPKCVVDFEAYGFTLEDWGKNDDLSISDCLSCLLVEGSQIKNPDEIAEFCPLETLK